MGPMGSVTKCSGCPPVPRSAGCVSSGAAAVARFAVALRQSREHSKVNRAALWYFRV